MPDFVFYCLLGFTAAVAFVLLCVLNAPKRNDPNRPEFDKLRDAQKPKE